MAHALAPRPSQGIEEGSSSFPSSHRPRKISTACGACKQRKTRCTGGNPCEACSTRGSPCVYDASSDQRRKIANQRNVMELADTQVQLERMKQLLGGILATIRAGDYNANTDLIETIRSGVSLSQLAAHVRNECRANVAIQQAYDQMDFKIDGPLELPSPTQLLRHLPSQPSADNSAMSLSLGSESNSDLGANNVFPGDGTPTLRRT